MAFERIGIGGIFSMDVKPAIEAVRKAKQSFTQLSTKMDAQGPLVQRWSLKFNMATKSVNRNLRMVGAGLASVGAGLRTASLSMIPLSYGMARGVGVAAEFEHQLAAVGSIVGKNLEEIEDLRQKAKQMGIDSAFSAKQAGQAMEFMARAGAENHEIIAGLDGVMNAAAADGLDLAAASNVIATVTKSMGREWSEASAIADALAMTSMRTNTNMLLLGESFTYGAATARTLGMTVEQTSAIFGAMADAGIKGSMAGTSFANMMNKLAKPSEKAAGMLKKWGIQLTQKGRIKDFPKIIAQLGAKIKGIRDPLQRAGIMSEMFGMRGQKAFAALMAKGPAALTKLMDEVEYSFGAAAEAAERRLNTLTGQFTLFKSSVQGAFIEMFEPMQTPLKETMKGIIGNINAVLRSVQYFKAAEKGGKAITSMFGDMKKELFKYHQAQAGWTNEDLRRDRNKVKALKNRVAEEMALNKFTLEAATKEGKRRFFLMHIERIHGRTVRQIAEGVIDAIKWMRETWENLKNSVVQFFRDMGKSFGEDGVRKLTAFLAKVAIGTAVVTPFLVVLGALAWVIKGTLGPIIMGAIKILTVFRNVLSSVAMAMWKVISASASLAIRLSKSVAVSALTATDSVLKFAESLILKLEVALKRAYAGMIKFAKSFVPTIKAMVTGFIPATKRAYTATINYVRSLMIAAVTMGQRFYAAMIRGAKAVWTYTVRIATGALPATKSFIVRMKQAAIASAKNFFPALMRSAKAIMLNTINMIRGMIPALIGFIKGSKKASTSTLRSLIPSFLKMGKAILFAGGPILLLVTIIANAFQNVESQGMGFMGTMKAIWQAISNTVGAFFKGFMSTLDDIWLSAKKVFYHIYKFINSIFGWILGDSKTTNNDLQKGFEEAGVGIGKAFSGALDIIGGFFNSVSDWIAESRIGMQDWLASLSQDWAELKHGMGIIDKAEVQRARNASAWIRQQNQKEREARQQKLNEEKEMLRKMEEEHRKAAERRARQERTAAKKGKTAFNITLEDKRTTEVKSTMCVDGEAVGTAMSRHSVEIHERGGFKAVPWRRRQALQHGAIDLIQARRSIA